MLGCNVAPANGQLMVLLTAPLAPECRAHKSGYCSLCTQHARSRCMSALCVRLETGLGAYRPNCRALVNTRSDVELFQPHVCVVCMTCYAV